jgi:hypothetical protein
MLSAGNETVEAQADAEELRRNPQAGMAIGIASL